MKEKREDIEYKPGFPRMDTGYSIPEGYFESFGDRLKLRMESEKQISRSKRVLLYLKPALGFAASLAIILTVYLHPFSKQPVATNANVQNEATISEDDQIDQISSTYASLVTDGQFFSALSEMDEYDASKMPKDALADYLATNCSDFEILNANK